MFSATITGRTQELAARIQTDAIRIDAGAVAGLPDHIGYEAVVIAATERENAIVNLLRFHDAVGAIVFCATREGVTHLANRLENRGFKVVALSGALAQAKRDAAMTAMRNGRARVCVATDVAARGIDLPMLELVIHADLPADVAALIHRSGRTGRAGRKGRAVLIAPHPQRRKAEALIARAGVAATWSPAPSADAVLARDAARMLAELEAIAETVVEASLEERRAAAQLLAARGADTLALAFVRIHQRARPAPERLTEWNADDVRPARPRLREALWFTLNCGQTGKAEARWMLPLICRLGHVTKADIGRIVVRARDTRFQISTSAAKAFSAAVARANDAGVKICRIAGLDAEGPFDASDVAAEESGA